MMLMKMMLQQELLRRLDWIREVSLEEHVIEVLVVMVLKSVIILVGMIRL